MVRKLVGEGIEILFGAGVGLVDGDGVGALLVMELAFLLELLWDKR